MNQIMERSYSIIVFITRRICMMLQNAPRGKEVLTYGVHW